MKTSLAIVLATAALMFSAIIGSFVGVLLIAYGLIAGGRTTAQEVTRLPGGEVYPFTQTVGQRVGFEQDVRAAGQGLAGGVLRGGRRLDSFDLADGTPRVLGASPQADIRVIDMRTVAGCLGEAVKMAVQWRSEALTVDQIEQRLHALIPRSRTYFLVATLEYLQRNGRIGGASSLIGSVLQIPPASDSPVRCAAGSRCSHDAKRQSVCAPQPDGLATWLASPIAIF